MLFNVQTSLWTLLYWNSVLVTDKMGLADSGKLPEGSLTRPPKSHSLQPQFCTLSVWVLSSKNVCRIKRFHSMGLRNARNCNTPLVFPDRKHKNNWAFLSSLYKPFFLLKLLFLYTLGRNLHHLLQLFKCQDLLRIEKHESSSATIFLLPGFRSLELLERRITNGNSPAKSDLF